MMQQTELELDFTENCRSCAENIQKALKILPGVKRAHVEFKKRKAIVEYDERQIDPERMSDVIERAGYHTQHA